MFDDDVEDVTSAQALITNLRDGPPLLRERCDVRTGVSSGKKSTLLSLQYVHLRVVHQMFSMCIGTVAVAD